MINKRTFNSNDEFFKFSPFRCLFVFSSSQLYLVNANFKLSCRRTAQKKVVEFHQRATVGVVTRERGQLERLVEQNFGLQVASDSL